MRALVAFLRLTRPIFLLGGIAGVALGAAVAASTGRRIDADSYCAAQLVVSAFQLMVHYANDWFDRAGDAGALPGTRTAWSGGSGVLAEGVLSPRTALVAAGGCAAIGIAGSAWFALAGNALAAGLGAAILVLAWCYSAPPVRFAARGLGELDAAIIVAVLVPALGYAAFAGRVDGALLNAASAPFLAMLAMMLCVELPDAGTDSASGKRTLVVRWGYARVRFAIGVLALVALAQATVVALQLEQRPGVLALLPGLGFATRLIALAKRDARPASFAFAGAGFSATLTAGLAVAYALAAAAR